MCIAVFGGIISLFGGCGQEMRDQSWSREVSRAS